MPTKVIREVKPEGSNFHEVISKPITSLEEAHAFFNDLHWHGVLFNPDDSPRSVIGDDGRYMFTEHEAALLTLRLAEVLLVDSDPCAYILETVLKVNVQ